MPKVLSGVRGPARRVPGGARDRSDEDEQGCGDLASSCISQACHDPAKATLDVTFAESGVTHRYYDVPDGVAQRLVSGAGSAGRFYNRRIKGQFRRRRLNR